jgi:hypothetical protein
MTYYVRRSKDAEIEGPFRIEQINRMLRQKRFTPKSPAIADNGQGLQAVRDTPMKHWIRVADIPGYEPDQGEAGKGNCLPIAIIVLFIVGLLVLFALVKLNDILRRIQ